MHRIFPMPEKKIYDAAFPHDRCLRIGRHRVPEAAHASLRDSRSECLFEHEWQIALGPIFGDANAPPTAGRASVASAAWRRPESTAVLNWRDLTIGSADE
jgi:hypothetical protein